MADDAPALADCTGVPLLSTRGFATAPLYLVYEEGHYKRWLSR